MAFHDDHGRLQCPRFGKNARAPGTANNIVALAKAVLIDIVPCPSPWQMVATPIWMHGRWSMTLLHCLGAGKRRGGMNWSHLGMQSYLMPRLCWPHVPVKRSLCSNSHAVGWPAALGMAILASLLMISSPTRFVVCKRQLSSAAPCCGGCAPTWRMRQHSRSQPSARQLEVLHLHHGHCTHRFR